MYYSSLCFKRGWSLDIAKRKRDNLYREMDNHRTGKPAKAKNCNGF